MNVAVLGAGSWGLALAQTMARNGHTVYLWDRDTELMNCLAKTDRCTEYIIPSATFPLLERVLLIFLVVPSYKMREVCRSVKYHCFPQGVAIIGTCKGIEPETLQFASQIVEEELGDVIYCHLGGPGFAKGLLEYEDTRLIVASKDGAARDSVVRALSNSFLSVQQTDDIIGLQVVGACRTTLSIARGAASALKYYQKQNTMGAMFGRVLAETGRLVRKLGGELQTVIDSSGDFSLCDDPESRNFALGRRIVQVAFPDEWTPQKRLAKIQEAAGEIGTVEGFQTAKALHQLAHQHEVDMPWVKAVFDICHQGVSVSEVVESIQQRARRR